MIRKSVRLPNNYTVYRTMQKLRYLVREFIYHIVYLLGVKFPRIYKRQSSLRLLKTSKPPLVRLVDFDGVKFGMWIGAKGAIEDSILRWGSWSPDLLALSDYFIKPGTTIVEVGANIGFESLYYAKKYPDCEVVSYEPSNYGFGSLLKSNNYNKFNNLTIHKIGLGDRRSQLEISSPTELSENKGLGSFNKNCDVDETYVSESVEVLPLDEHYRSERQISLVKIDTQGFESQVIKGAQSLLKKHKPVIIFEFEDHYHANPTVVRRELNDILKSLGYDLFIRDGENLFPLDFAGAARVHNDVIALPAI